MSEEQPGKNATPMGGTAEIAAAIVRSGQAQAAAIKEVADALDRLGEALHRVADAVS